MAVGRIRWELAWTVVAVCLAGFVASWLPGVGEAWRGALACVPGKTLPHTWATFPLAFLGNSMWELAGLLWLFFVVRMAEPSLGWRGVALGLVGGSVLPAAAASAAAPWAPGVPLLGPSVPAAMLTAYVAARDPRREVLLFGAFRLALLWVGVLAVAAVVVNYGAGDPARGFVLALPAVLFWLWGSGRVARPAGRSVQSGRGGLAKSPREFDEFLDKVREKQRRREEEEAVRRLFEGSEGPGEKGGPGSPS